MTHWSKEQLQTHEYKLARKGIILSDRKPERVITKKDVQAINNVCKINIKLLSVNRAWQGRRFKTKEYKNFEKSILSLLPNIELPKPPYRFNYEFGFSNNGSDLLNPEKLITDILQTKYKFNDNAIHEMFLKKVITNKGEEYFLFHIESIN